MPSLGQRGLAACALAALAAAAACDRKPAPARAESMEVVPTVRESVPPPPPVATTTWDADAGLALIVPGEQGDARVVVPGTGAGAAADTVAGRAEAVLPGEVLLLSRAGIAGRARALPDPAAAGACPAARLGPASGADALPAWTVGLVVPAGAPAVRPLPLDSLVGIPSADSAALAAGVTRLASALPVEGESRRLRGLPFVVRSAVRLRPDSVTQTVAAVLTRSLPQEAAPVGEMILLVAERPADAPATAHWTLAYHERVSGHEESLPAAEVLAALRVGAAGRAALVLARAAEEGTRFSLLERVAPGQWAVRWTSAGGC